MDVMLDLLGLSILGAPLAGASIVAWLRARPVCRHGRSVEHCLLMWHIDGRRSPWS
jgi:hypothetical protein